MNRLAKPAKEAAAKEAGPSWASINEAYSEFRDALTIKALIIGQMLREKRAALSPWSHDETTGRFEHKKDTFAALVNENCDISRPTAYRWMEMAENVCTQALKDWNRLGNALGGDVIDLSSQDCQISHLLTAPQDELSGNHLAARQLLLDFVGDKTMSQCLAKVMTGDAEAHAVTRAHNGRTKGGAGGDRKAFDEFVRRKLSHISTHLENKMEGDQQAKVITHFASFVGTAPRWLLLALAPAIKEELKLNESDRQTRNETNRGAAK